MEKEDLPLDNVRFSFTFDMEGVKALDRLRKGYGEIMGRELSRTEMLRISLSRSHFDLEEGYQKGFEPAIVDGDEIVYRIAASLPEDDMEQKARELVEYAFAPGSPESVEKYFGEAVRAYSDGRTEDAKKALTNYHMELSPLMPKESLNAMVEATLKVLGGYIK